MQISIIVPVFNEAEGIEPIIKLLQDYRQAGHELIVVDGGSEDATLDLVSPHVDRVIHSGKGRARQMNIGAKEASHEVLFFVHADTHLPAQADHDIRHSIENNQHLWGRFDVTLSGAGLAFRIIEWFMNRRSRLTSIATGDQAIFVRKDIFAQVGGFDEIPLMEDIALSKKLKALGKPACLRARVITSSRRWEENGILHTVLLMWRLRFAYWRGVDPAKLAMRYR